MTRQTDWHYSAFPRLLAQALILWEGRVRDTHVVATNAWTRKEFADHLCRYSDNDFVVASPALSRTDIDAAIELFLDEYRTLFDWYRVLVCPPRIILEWHDFQPFIAPETITEWERLCSDFDQDTLLTFDLVDRQGLTRRIEQLADLSNWRTIARVSDHELSVLASRGLSDLHIHVGGVRVPHLSWQEVLADDAGVEIYRILNMIYTSNGRNFKADMAKARSNWHSLRSNAQLSEYLDPGLLRPKSNQWWRPLPEILAQERLMLVTAWSKAITTKDKEFILKLDVYLTHKHRFFRLVRQRAFSTQPGLRQFDVRYFSALKTSAAKVPNFAYGSSPRLEMTAQGDACRYVMESKDLRRIELRIAPVERASECLRFFKLWETLKNQLKLRLISRGKNNPLDLDNIRFAVHFKRTREREQSVKRLPDAVRKRLALDRQTVALRIALSDPTPTHRERMAALSRIDVAGQERDTPLALFAIYLRLLRGEPKALAYLDNLPPDEASARGLDCWMRLQRRGDHRPRLDEARLGLTVHAGEDFADLLDGLYQIGAAIDAVHLQAGDGIGHALALKSDFEAFGIRAPEFVMMPIGAAHDSLCWLYDFAERHAGPLRYARERERLGDLIKDTADEIYGDLLAEMHGAEAADHVWVWEHNVMPFADTEKSTKRRRNLLKLNLDYQIMLNRERIVPADRRRRGLDELVRWAQATLLLQIQKKRIVIEMNPSSNLRISGAVSAQDSPTVQLFQAVTDGLLACVNTDNPGVFTSCIENEYALLLDGATNAKMPEGRARGLLESVRQVGMDIVYWPGWQR